MRMRGLCITILVLYILQCGLAATNIKSGLPVKTTKNPVTPKPPRVATLTDIQRLEKTIQKLREDSVKAKKELEKAHQKSEESSKAAISSLARQVQLQQQYVEESARAEGDSGIKQIRTNTFGTRPYFSNSFTGFSVASIHDHSNNIRTCGMGEFTAVLNGVEFRTRHNDFRLNMPSINSTKYGAYEPIPFPEVPPQVLAKKTVQDQIVELREWFKAFKRQDYSTRDYRKYFKPVLCYLEGMWTVADKDGKVEEPFFSDRHSIDAASWFDLQEKIRFTSTTGRKSKNENFAFLPTTITSLDANGMPMYAQWNYQILCHPLKRDVPLSRFRLASDLGVRVSRGKTLEDFLLQRSARFEVYPDQKEFTGVFKQEHQTKGDTFLDDLMTEIPGKDNYKAHIVDDVFDLTAFDVDSKFPSYQKMNASNMPPALNTGFYHRNYKISGRDAMGLSKRTRGYSDASLYVALNNQEKVAPTKITQCTTNFKCFGKARREKKCSRQICKDWVQRASYAIPLEIIYLTPLSNWNPYNLEHYSENKKAYEEKMVNNKRRTGGMTKETAYAGTVPKLYYRTPASFYQGVAGIDKDPADTVRDSVGVLDRAGIVRKVTSSGIRIALPNIPSVGVIRQRYPIMPIHQAGNFIYKEVEAVKDILLKASQYRKFYPNETPFGFGISNGTIEFDETYTYELKVSTKTPPGAHTHTVELTTSDLKTLKHDKKTVTVTTSDVAGHTHEVELAYYQGTYKTGTFFEGKKFELVYIRNCDSIAKTCWDGHTGQLQCVDCPLGEATNILPIH